MRHWKLYFAIVIFIIGGLIYLIYRPTSLIMFEWSHKIGIEDWIISLREQFGRTVMPNWVVYSLPDGLWLLSYLIIIDSIWYKSHSILFYCFILALPVIALLSEILQLFGVINGVFDIIDFLFYILAFLFYLLINYFKL